MSDTTAPVFQTNADVGVIAAHQSTVRSTPLLPAYQTAPSFTPTNYRESPNRFISSPIVFDRSYDEATEMNKSFPWVNGIISASRRTMDYREVSATSILDVKAGHESWDAASNCALACRKAYNQLADDYTEAVAINASFVALPTWASLTTAMPTASSAVTPQADTEAALRQAELLGATADQRRKLRGIVEEAASARKATDELAARNGELAARLEAQRLNIVAYQTQITQLQEQSSGSGAITDPADKRVWEIFGKAAAEADRQGYCSVYDQISTAVGIPTRDALREAGFIEEPSWDVKMYVQYEGYITVTVPAANYDAAIRAADELSLTDVHQEGLDLDQLEFERFTIRYKDARDANRVED